MAVQSFCLKQDEEHDAGACGDALGNGSVLMGCRDRRNELETCGWTGVIKSLIAGARVGRCGDG